ncbi:MAG: rod shape-determining protein MreD [Bacteroidetes bacterium HGW-Bacteroidetes-15]|nr:MAG: rod shape-determining protein MreD [Bacteroidetes bacterium HGW-Bacteroidetes-15]
MGKDILKYFGLFVILILLQLLLFNNIQLSGFINPYIYVLFILVLPYETPGWLLLLLGFLSGFVLDTFMNTFGMHSSATLFMAFMRPIVLNMLTDREDIDKKGSPSMVINGLGWFLRYSIILILLHHFVLFFIESFTFFNFFSTLWRIILSTIVTSAFIVLSQFLTPQRSLN